MVVRAKLKVAVRKKVRMCGVKVPKRIDIAKLKDPDVKNCLMLLIPLALMIEDGFRYWCRCAGSHED